MTATLPTRHAASHGLAVLVCTLAAGGLQMMLESAVPGFLAYLTLGADELLQGLALPMSGDSVARTALAAALGAVWGIGYHYSAGGIR